MVRYICSNLGGSGAHGAPRPPHTSSTLFVFAPDHEFAGRATLWTRLGHALWLHELDAPSPPDVLGRSVPHLLLRDTNLRSRTALVWLGVPPMRGHVLERPARPRVRLERRGVGSRRRLLRIHTTARPWVGPVHAHQAGRGDASAGGDRYKDQKDLHCGGLSFYAPLQPRPQVGRDLCSSRGE